MNDKPLYKPFKSKAKNKKYSVYVMKGEKKRLIHFGDSRYEQFKDKIGYFSHLDHGDKKEKRIIILDMGRRMIKILLNIGVIRFYGENNNQNKYIY